VSEAECVGCGAPLDASWADPSYCEACVAGVSDAYAHDLGEDQLDEVVDLLDVEEAEDAECCDECESPVWDHDPFCPVVIGEAFSDDDWTDADGYGEPCQGDHEDDGDGRCMHCGAYAAAYCVECGADFPEGVDDWDSPLCFSCEFDYQLARGFGDDDDGDDGECAGCGDPLRAGESEGDYCGGCLGWSSGDDGGDDW
jgi:hypothetical protein